MTPETNDADDEPIGTATDINHADRLLHRLVWDVSAISFSILRMAELLGRRVGLTGSQWLLIKAVDFLADRDGVPVGEVAALLNMKGSFVSAQIRPLEQRGLLNRTQSAEDRRVILLSLTGSAKQTLTRVEDEICSIEEIARGTLVDRHVGELSDSVNAMRRRMDRATARVARLE
ncbi:MarR family transcriptional regulator [Rhodopseudomonas palustris]|nr:MarR family transcriptional regulator [Rhodopseudomonas palustris]RIA02432.1 MarR family transcriptional regulator [Rhodopseudomonas palustris]